MGAKKSTPAVSPFSSEASLRLTCDPCINQDKPARGWCGQCNVYLCTQCVQKHTRSHKVAVGPKMPLTRPKPESLTNNVPIKQVKPWRTLQDDEAKAENSDPQEKLNIFGCVSIGEYIVTLTYHKIKLYDAEFRCIGEMHFGQFHPNSICAQAYDIAVSFEREQDEDCAEEGSSVDKTKYKGSAFKDIQLFSLKLQSCVSGTRLAKTSGFKTEGRCFTISTCPVEEKKGLIIAAGMRIDSHPERDDIEFQVQILKSNGNVMYTLQINQRGEPCFEAEFFICGTRKFAEIAVSEVKQKCVRGIDVRTGKTVFEFEGGSPQGLATDKEDNIYVYNDSAFFWIPPLRNKIHHMLQGYVKKKQRQQKMVSSLCFNEEKRILYVTNNKKDTIETYRV